MCWQELKFIIEVHSFLKQCGYIHTEIDVSFCIMLMSQDSVTGYKLQDEKTARASSILHALSCISQASLICRRKALFAVLHMKRDNDMPLSLVRKVIFFYTLIECSSVSGSHCGSTFIRPLLMNCVGCMIFKNWKNYLQTYMNVYWYFILIALAPFFYFYNEVVSIKRWGQQITKYTSLCLTDGWRFQVPVLLCTILSVLFSLYYSTGVRKKLLRVSLPVLRQ